MPVALLIHSTYLPSSSYAIMWIGECREGNLPRRLESSHHSKFNSLVHKLVAADSIFHSLVAATFSHYALKLWANQFTPQPLRGEQQPATDSLWLGTWWNKKKKGRRSIDARQEGNLQENKPFDLRRVLDRKANPFDLCYVLDWKSHYWVRNLLKSRLLSCQFSIRLAILRASLIHANY